jgi:hypothetical protein
MARQQPPNWEITFKLDGAKPRTMFLRAATEAEARLRGQRAAPGAVIVRVQQAEETEGK